jgi:hypothetical protein
MSKISTYNLADTPLQLSDRLIGTEAPRPTPTATPLATKNFSLGELLQLFSSNFPAASLQAVLDANNTATEDINLTGTINTTLIKPGNIIDMLNSQGTPLQILSKGVGGICWIDGPNLSGYVPTSRELTINGVTYDLSANRSWTVIGNNQNLQDVTDEGANTTNPISINDTITNATIGISSNEISFINSSGLTGVSIRANEQTGNVGELLIPDVGITPKTIALTSDIGTWGALDYPIWTAGTPFVKMTAAGTFSLDTNIYALDSDVVHKTGNENIDGTKTFTGSAINKIILDTGNNIGVFGGIGALFSGINFYSQNQGTNTGIYADTSGNGAASRFVSIGAGDVLLLESTSTGRILVGKNGGTETTTIDRFGNIIANSFAKAGGTSSQYLMADGSVTTGPSLAGYVPTTRTLTINGTDLDLSANRSWNVGTVTSVGMTVPSAFSVTPSTITSSGTFAITGAGSVSQYVRGDGSLANFPSSSGGGSSVNYYLNGSVSQGTFGGDTYYEMSRTPILGAGTNFVRTNGAGNGYIASFITDAGDPSFLNIPGGNWNLEFYFQASSGGGSPQFYAEIYKVSVTNVFTLVASGSANPEGITNGTTVDQYFTSIPVPQTTLLVTDRLAVRIYIITGGRTITLHTENGNLCEILTTFTTGLTALNGLTDQVQNFAVGTSGTNFNISSATNTHTFNLPDASATARGVVTTGTQTIAGTKTFTSEVIVNNAIRIALGNAGGTNLVVGNAFGSGLNVASTGNIAIGSGALTTIGTGVAVSNNIAIGSLALNVGSQMTNNVAIGTGALRRIQFAAQSNNVAVGFSSGELTNTGGLANGINQCTLIGSQTTTLNNNDVNSIVIGFQGRGNGSNTVTLGNTSITDTFLRGRVNIQQYTTGTRPAYVKGAIIFDTTLNKLVVGGATGWEVVTSV